VDRFSWRRSDGGEKRAKSGALELEVLKIVWEYPACTVAEAAERLPGGSTRGRRF